MKTYKKCLEAASFEWLYNRSEFNLGSCNCDNNCDNSGEQLPSMASSQDVYSEDDNFLIGDDFNTDRHRREARQLHLSQFRTTRREAHFARYRNSFLKCDLDQKNDRIEQERRLRSAEMERARAAIVKQAESRRKVKSYSLNENDAMMFSVTDGKPIILINNISSRREAKYKSEDLGNDSRLARQSHRSFRHSVTNLNLSRASSVTGERACDSGEEIEQAIKSPTVNKGGSKGSSLGSNADQQQASEVNPSLNAGSANGNEAEIRSSSASESKPASERNLTAKSLSAKTSNGKTPLLNRRKGSAVSFHESHAKKTQSQSAHERWVWTEFDKIMKGFADFLQIEHKSLKLRSGAAVAQDTKSRPPPNITLNFRNTLSPFYFRYGLSAQIAFRF